MNQEKGFYWQRHAEAEKACLDFLDDCRRKSMTLARFEQRLIRETSSRLLDWVDHFYIAKSQQVREKLVSLGFIRKAGGRHEAYFHPGAVLPGFVLAGHSSENHEQGVGLRVESIADFLQCNGFRAEIEGSPYSPFRRALLGTDNGVSLTAIERRGTRDYEPVHMGDAYLRTYLRASEVWKNRSRVDDNEDLLFAEIGRTVDHLISQLGPDLAADVICRSERSYWLSRNYAARVQQGRHDTMGLGWANQDHYTFRSSRRNFSRLVDLFSRLGFRNRERFYAGSEAGWGAQVMENGSGLTLFLDVDLAPEEVETDFSREQLKPTDKLGTVGLWCALHGDSVLQAGVHHIAARFDFERLIKDIARYGVEYMAPFSNFDYLKQAFSTAEKWQVDPMRIEALIRAKAITSEQGDRFLSHGAVGSHLESIERREGYKGFNRKNVSAIIRETDPRKLAA